MRIVVDINHPAHVHYFKNFIWEMQNRGHEILITASEKDIAYQLLRAYHFNFIPLGTYGLSLREKLFKIPILDIKMYSAVKKFKPDLFLGFGSIRAAHVSRIMRKPCVALDDTEHAKWEHALYVPFTDSILTPSCFTKNFGKKQIRYNGYTELAYLHPNRFTPDPAVLKEIGLTKDDPFFVIRFVSWNASHDVGAHGLTLDIKRKAIHEFEKYGRVIITSEKPLPEEFEKYRIAVSPEKMHDLLFYATLLFGESATMASECAVLGTHAIFCDLAGRGYTDEEESKYHLVYNFKLDKESQERSIEKAVELVQNPHLKEIARQKKAILLRDKSDVTAFIVWFIENYPESFTMTKSNSQITEIYR